MAKTPLSMTRRLACFTSAGWLLLLPLSLQAQDAPTVESPAAEEVDSGPVTVGTTTEVEGPAAPAQAVVPPPDPELAAGSPAPSPTTPISSDSDAELEAAIAAIEDDAGDRGLHLSGFMDCGYGHAFRANRFLKFEDSNDSIAVGNANIYFAANIRKHLRSLLEIRFTYLPNGSSQSRAGIAPEGLVDTSAGDYTSALPTPLGSVIIERAYGEYDFMRELQVRVGQWLTPYGVWNVDHGSPVIIPIGIPFAVGLGLMPERQTGLDIFGMIDLRRAQLEYHATVSNGRGPFDSHLDLDRNKALGYRVQLEWQRLGDWRLGHSGYYGTFTNAVFDPDKPGEPIPTKIVTQNRELSLAADLKWTWRGLHVQGEFVHQQVVYSDKGRVDDHTGQVQTSDKARWGGYGLVGFRIPEIELMPYFKIERFSYEPIYVDVLTGGLNFRPYPELVVKVEFSKIAHRVDVGGVKTDSDALVLGTQIAWAF